MVEESFVPIEGVAKHFSVSISTVRAWIRQSLVPSLKIGGVYRFKISEVEQALRKLSGGELVREEVDGSLTVQAPAGSTQMVLNFNPDEDI
jgi:excisionase family DNA binding protein